MDKVKRVMSGETKAKIRESNKGKERTEETKANLSAAHKGQKLSEETKAKISKRMLQNSNLRKLEKEAKARVSATKKNSN